jgi:putative transposase
MLKVVDETAVSSGNAAAGRSLLDEIVRDGARRMLVAALQAEVATYIDAYVGELDDDGHRLVVRNGSHGEREVMTAAGVVAVRAPRVNDKRLDRSRGSGCGLHRRSCRRGRVSHRRSPRCCAAVSAWVVQR